MSPRPVPTKPKRKRKSSQSSASVSAPSIGQSVGHIQLVGDLRGLRRMWVVEKAADGRCERRQWTCAGAQEAERIKDAACNSQRSRTRKSRKEQRCQFFRPHPIAFENCWVRPRSMRKTYPVGLAPVWLAVLPVSYKYNLRTRETGSVPSNPIYCSFLWPNGDLVFFTWPNFIWIRKLNFGRVRYSESQFEWRSFGNSVPLSINFVGTLHDR